MSRYDKFYTYLCELHSSHLRLIDLLKNKLVAISDSDLDTLDDTIKEEQVYVLASKSFENNIARYRRELSLSGDKLSEIIPNMPDDEQGRFFEIFENLESGLSLANELNQKCQTLLESKLYSINKSLRELENKSPSTYSKLGSDKSGNLLTKSV